MDTEAAGATAAIQRCVRLGRYRVLAHFTSRMDRRCLFWPDIQAVVDCPDSTQAQGHDEFGRPKWLLTGKATDGLLLAIVCALDTDDRGEVTVFITAYWDEG